MKVMRKALIATAVAAAIAGTAHGAQVIFDINGGLGPNTIGTDRFAVSVFDWLPGNLLIKDTAQAASGSAVNMYMQAEISSITGIPKTTTTPDLTYQMILPTVQTAGGGSSTDYNPSLVPGVFNIYFGGTPNDISGCGYGVQNAAHCSGGEPGDPATVSGVLIYSGTATLQGTGNLTDSGLLASPSGLDQSATGGDVDEGITTNVLALGNMNVLVLTTFHDPNFFITVPLGFPTSFDHTETGGGAPFKIPNPSDEVVLNQISRPTGDGTGLAFRLDTYGLDLRNNTGAGSCGVVSSNNNPCDVHLANDASSTVLGATLPEPASLALLGLGLAGLGVSLRRRKRVA